ncbi:MAG: DUF4160 domain-containing protein [Geobacter sp.]|nr:DUF4160 domain-containing protein [Geobacter sp.]
MPIIFRYKGYRLFFFSNEGNPLEPLHVHIRQGGALAKFWVVPDVAIAESYGMTSSELRELVEVVEQNRELIERKWHEYFDA